jgi:hypothetical protein
VALFDDFLRDTVNLNTTRIDKLEDSVGAIKRFVNGSDWEPKLAGWLPQGSWAHKTIIKPVDQGEFDADLIVFVCEVAGWTAADYVDTLHAQFLASGTYKDKVRRYSHCVTITYANEAKIDVAPCVVDRGGWTRHEVCNRDTGAFERSEPEGYTAWMIEQNGYSGFNSFRKVTRLLKYLRDIKTTFTCPSILLTTLLGYFIKASDKGSDAFADTPTALKTLMGRLDDFLQQHPSKPAVPNPKLPSENFADLWTPEQYGNFRKTMHRYRGWIDDAYDEADRKESIRKWRRVFGDDFASDVVLKEAASVSDAARMVVENASLLARGAFDAGADLVRLVSRFGASVLPSGFSKQIHMRQPIWRPAINKIPVIIRAYIGNDKTLMNLSTINSLQPLSKGQDVQFVALGAMGQPFPAQEYEVHWRITNTDREAVAAKAIRGDIYASDTPGRRKETLSYRGVHIVEAFVVLKRTRDLVGESEPFYIMIE